MTKPVLPFWDSPLPAILQDDRHRLVDVNDAFVTYCGYARERLLGIDLLTLTPDEDRHALLAARDAKGALLEGRLIDARGRERWYRITRESVRDRGRVLQLGLLQDITDEKLARDAALRSVHELEQWFDFSPVGMVLFDEAGLLVRSNAAFESLVEQVPVTLAEAGSGLQQLLGWTQGMPHEALQPGVPPLQWQVVLSLPHGRTQRLSALVRAFDTALGQRRYMAVVEDRSAEEERDLARLELGAMMDTAGVGIATFAESRGWVRSAVPGAAGAPAASAALQAIKRELVEPASLPDYERLQQALRSGERAEVRYAVRHPQLGLRWLLTRVEPGQLAPGQRTTSVVTQDVTERELARQRSEQLLGERDVMFSLSEVGIAYLRDGRIVRANDAMAELTGYSVAELAQFEDALLFADRAAYLACAAQEASMVEREGRSRLERPLRRRDGSLLWVQASKRLVDEADASAGLICAYVNIDERRRAEASLQRQTERTRAILDSVLVGIVTVGRQGIEWMNRSARRMFAGDLADFVGEPIATVATPEDDHPLRRTHYLDTLPEGQAESFECRLRARDGREFWVVGNAVVTGHEAERQLTFALLDIERRRQAELAISEQRDAEAARLHEALAQRDRLVKEVHHRIKNNLQGVAGLLQQVALRRPEVKGVIGEAVNQVQAIAQVYGLQVRAAGPLRLGALVQGIAGSLSRSAGRTIVLQVRGEDSAPWTLSEADSIPIALTVNELLGNAIKHAEGDAAEVHCSVECGEAEVRIVITNPGQLPEGFDVAVVRSGVSGLGLVRALLPRRHASLTLQQNGSDVVACIGLAPPGVTRVIAAA
jgi:PAS domain S-box-containing protein